MMSELAKEEKMITGQLFFRDADGDAARGMAGPGRKIMMVVGLIAVPDEADLKGEHQYVVCGIPEKGVTELQIHHRFCKDVSDVSIGNTPTGILTSPIWRV